MRMAKETIKSDFRKELEKSINITCRENGSNTPDYILAEFLGKCLHAFDNAVNQREMHYGRKPAFAVDLPKDD